MHSPLDGADQMFEYWRSLPKIDLVPDRSSFDFLKIARIMPDLVMVEYPLAETVKFRFVGSRVTDLLDFDPTSKAYIDLLLPRALDDFLFASSAIISVPCGGRFSIVLQAATGFVLRLEVLDLPMRNAAKENDIILAHVSRSEVVAYTGIKDFHIHSIRLVEWYDIGAGTPDIASSHASKSRCGYYQ